MLMQDRITEDQANRLKADLEAALGNGLPLVHRQWHVFLATGPKVRAYVFALLSRETADKVGECFSAFGLSSVDVLAKSDHRGVRNGFWRVRAVIPKRIWSQY